MRKYRIWIPIIASIVAITGAISVQADSSKEVQPVQAMSGIITDALETGKILLASSDKIVVSFKKDYGIKPGDYLEIFEPLDPKKKGGEENLFKKIGLGIIVEKIDVQQAVCIIDSSVKEISLGNLVRVVTPR